MKLKVIEINIIILILIIIAYNFKAKITRVTLLHLIKFNIIKEKYLIINIIIIK